MTNIILYIIFFIIGSLTGMFLILFMLGVHTNNTNYDYYQEGFSDGYQKGKQECNQQSQDIDLQD